MQKLWSLRLKFSYTKKVYFNVREILYPQGARLVSTTENEVDFLGLKKKLCD